MINNLPPHWDLEADVVAIGSGIGGLSAAITAHENGASAIVLERSDQVGGVTALSMGEVWVAGNHHAAELGIEDSADSGFRYLKRLSMGYGSDARDPQQGGPRARGAAGISRTAIGLKMEVDPRLPGLLLRASPTTAWPKAACSSASRSPARRWARNGSPRPASRRRCPTA